MNDFAPALEKLEFHKILDRLSQLVSSEPARTLVRQIRPLTDIPAIRLELERVSEAKGLLIGEGMLPLDGIKDVLTALKKSTITNHFLNATELIEIASTLRAARTLSAFFSKRRDSAPQLALLAGDLFYDRVVEFNIYECLEEDGSVKDGASKDLKRIRQDMVSTSVNLRKHLGTILKRVSEKDMAQEEIVTTRDGRMVIPVKAEHKNHVPGFIHSSSASGATVFIEPAETLDLNNMLRELQLREQREIARILTMLTDQVREIAPNVERTLSLLSLLDLIAAKAKYSIETMGSAPALTEERTLSLIQARHPVLLQKHRREEIVPLDLSFGGETRTLIITGPNAGGKSVAMKTAGLLALCAQAGLHIPASPETELCVFRKMFIDIGDDQSIENDLSTFSSHLVQMKQVLEEADADSLALIDEIGAGTDPAEGGALAAAILEDLTRRGCLTIATTHHGMLKAFAHETPHISNASMEFDQQTLQPTYRFRPEVPGSSYALELGSRLGLPSSIITAARGLVGEEKVRLEQLLIDLERQSQLYQQQIKEVSEERDRLDTLVQSYEQKIASLQKELKAIRSQAVAEAEQILQGAKALVERSVKEIRESGAEKSTVKHVREELEKLHHDIAAKRPEELPEQAEAINVGDPVRLHNGTEVGEVVELKGAMATVLWGNARLKVDRKDLRRERRRSTTTGQADGGFYLPEGKPEVDLRGMMGEEAVSTVQQFLDNALLTGLHRVDIIHGKGTGVLRKRIAEFLKTYPHVKSFRLGEWNEGGSGVTVVELAD